MPKCGTCKHWFPEGQFRFREGYWYCDIFKDFKYDPQNESCLYYEEKERIC